MHFYDVNTFSKYHNHLHSKLTPVKSTKIIKIFLKKILPYERQFFSFYLFIHFQVSLDLKKKKNNIYLFLFKDAYDAEKGTKISSTPSSASWLFQKFRGSFTKKLLYKRLPILEWLPNYQRDYIFNDIVAGITVGLTVIPQGIGNFSFLTKNSAQLISF